MASGLRSLFLFSAAGAALFPILARSFFRDVGSRLESTWRSLRAIPARRPKAILILIWLVAMLPMIHLTYLVRHYSVEIPTLDDWAMAPLIVKAQTGQLRFADIFEQQQEARTVLPKLIVILSAARGHWDVRDEMMFSVISCWLTAAGAFVLLRRSGLGLAASAISFWLIVLTIFSPAQYELWIFASGFPSFLPALFLVFALVAVGTRFTTRSKFLICAALAVASSFTLSHGLLLWGLTFPALLGMQRIPRWQSWLGLWLTTAGICALIYFLGYTKPDYLPAFAPAIPVLEYLRFALAFLGGGLAYAWKDHPVSAGIIFGALLLTLYCAALGYTIWRIRDRMFLGKVIPWFMLGLYSLGSALLGALGRIEYGAAYGLSSRYVTFSLYLTVAVIALVAITCSEFLQPHTSTRSRKWILAVCVLLVAGFLVPYKACAATTLFFLRGLSAKDRLARGAVLFSAAFDTATVIKKAAYPPDPDHVVRNAAALDRLKLLRPPLVRTNRLNVLAHGRADGRQASGSCENLVSVGEDLYRASGWALLNAKGRSADCVVVAYQMGENEDWIAFALSDSVEMWPDVVNRSPDMHQLWAGWSATFPRSAIPPRAKLSFWAVDADVPKLFQLNDQSSASRQ